MISHTMLFLIQRLTLQRKKSSNGRYWSYYEIHHPKPTGLSEWQNSLWWHHLGHFSGSWYCPASCHGCFETVTDAPALHLPQISTTFCTDSVPWGSRRAVPLMVIHEGPLTTSPLAMTPSSTSSEALGIQRRKALSENPSNGPIELKQQPPPFSGSSCKYTCRYKGCWLQLKELHRVPTAAWDKAENKTG